MVTGTFTATLLGVSGSVTATMYYTIQQYLDPNNTLVGTGQIVTLGLRGGTLTGTSNLSSMHVSGLPAILNGLDVANNNFVVPTVVVDNGISLAATANVSGNANIGFSLLDTGAVANRAALNSAGFTTSGTKGLSVGWFIQYPLAG